ncbi:MAG: hypothetical protein C5B50_28910 [Verrucomicrobia bacterium]|nr:MAG: hypothetical protein C5B50_28910 [Verrucomicrobiota bacterium]
MIRKLLRWLAAALVVGAVIWWIGAGANAWTKTSVPVPRTDEVTGITVNDYKRHFVPGLEFLAAVVAVSGVIAAFSFLFPKSGPARGPGENLTKESDRT